MALVFGRFDKAPGEVRDALMRLITEKTEATKRAAAMTIFEAAVDVDPDITSQDLSDVVCVLLHECRQLGFIGKEINIPHLSLHFLYLITPRPGWNGLPSAEDRYMTLAEISALHVAARQRQSRHQGRSFRR